MMSTAVSPYEMPIRVDAADIDELGHVNNIVYLRWVQDVATAHWLEAALPEDRAGLIWMVVRHEIDYQSPAVLNDEVILRTWIGHFDHRGIGGGAQSRGWHGT